MESKFLGVPIAIWVLGIVLAVLVDVPMVLLNNTNTAQLNKIERTLEVTPVRETPTVMPTASPSASETVTPTAGVKKVFQSVTVPVRQVTASPTP